MTTTQASGARVIAEMIHGHFAQIAGELGCEGVRIERPTDLGPAIQNALASGKPVVLDVLTDPTASHPRAWTPPALARV